MASLQPKLTELTILAVLSVTFSHCTPEDKVSVTPQSKEEVGILVDGTKDSAQIRDQVFRGPPNDQIAIGNFIDGKQTVIAYTESHAPTLKTGSTSWTSGADNASVPLEAEYRIKVVFWIVKGPFDKGADKAREFIDTTNWIWSKEAQGLRLVTEKEDPSVIRDATSRKNPKGSDVTQYLGSASEPLGCDVTIQDNEVGIGSEPNAINVYYVRYVAADDSPNPTPGGKNPSKSLGNACKITSPYWIVLGEDTDRDVLAHEMGHLFTLEHTDGANVKDHFDKKNVMYPAPRILATFLTEGQTLRSIVIDGSIINLVARDQNPKLSLEKCPDDIGINSNTATTDKDTVCPPLWIRIWADKGTNGRTWGPDLCWEGCGASVAMQGDSQLLTVNSGLPPAVNDALQFYLDVRCLVPEKGRAMGKPLTELLAVAKQFNAEKALEDKLLTLLRQGPDQQLLKEIEDEVGDEWTDLQSARSQVRQSKQNVPPVLTVTKEDYLRERLAKIKQRYRERSAVALLKMNSPKGVRAVRQEAARDEALRPLMETPLR